MVEGALEVSSQSAQPATSGVRYLGLDPGTNVLGYGIVEATPDGELHALLAGAIELARYPDAYERLAVIYRRVRALAREYDPAEVAVEAPFYGKNAQSMLRLGRAQGVAIAAVMDPPRPLVEYAPRRVKMAITGHGGAQKERVAYFLGQMFPGLDLTGLRYLDATDGLAVAACHALERGRTWANAPAAGGPTGGWTDFARRNPGRVK